MKVFVIHDEAGHIRGTVTSVRGDTQVRVPLGTQVHETEVAEMDSAERRRYLIDLHRNSNVETIYGETKLMRTMEKPGPR